MNNLLDLLELKFKEQKQLITDMRTAMHDWVHTYASEMCDPAQVEETNTRIYKHGGTLAYIAGLLTRADNELSGDSDRVSEMPIYTVTAFEHMKNAVPDGKNSLWRKSRVYGFYYKELDAHIAILGNYSDINESGSHPFALVEKVQEGLCAPAEAVAWYEWNIQKGLYEPCERPPEYINTENISLG